MKKKVTALLTTIILGIGSVSTLPNVKADENNNLQNIGAQRSGIKTEITKVNGEISQFQDELAKLNEQINRIDQAIKDNNEMIIQTEEKINISQLEIQELELDIATIKEKVSKRNEVLKKRAISLQESGGQVSYLNVLLGASSFSDFIDRVGAVASILEADQSLVKQYEVDKQDLEKKQEAVKNKLSDLTDMKTELEGMQVHILEQKELNDSLKEELKKKEQEKITEKAELQQKELDLTENDINESTTFMDESLPITNGTINDVIKAGYRYFGNSVYVFGGGRTAYDIANGRFDCSGFVHWAFAQVGINIGASTDALKNTGNRVSVSQMQPGDLVFFDTYKKDGHVGIYIGDGKFIGSQSSTGVGIADMNNSYWKPRFNGHVNRIISQ